MANKQEALIKQVAIISLYILGADTKEIAYRFKCDKSYIYRIIDIFRVPRRGSNKY